jgi:hypothetical protein
MVVLVENISKLVNICLSYPTLIPWRSYPDNTVSETLGWLFENDNQQYVVTPRYNILEATQIMCYLIRDNTVYVHEAQVVIQYMEFQIVILKLNENYISERKIQTRFNELVDESFLALESDRRSVEYCYYMVNERATTYQPIVYLPATHHYLVKWNDEGNLSGNIYISRGKWTGMVVDQYEDNMVVMPIDTITKLVNRYFTSGDNYGFADLPIQYRIVDDAVVISANKTIKYGDITKKIRAGDHLISVNGNAVYILDDQIFINGNRLLDDYLRIDMIPNQPISFTIRRVQEIQINAMTVVKPELPLPLTTYTSTPPYHLHTTVNNIVIAQVSHELIQTLINNDVNFTNRNFFDLEKPLTIILDCLDTELARRYNLPEITGNTNSVYFPRLMNETITETTRKISIMDEDGSKKIINI